MGGPAAPVAELELVPVKQAVVAASIARWDVASAAVVVEEAAAVELEHREVGEVQPTVPAVEGIAVVAGLGRVAEQS